MWVLIVLSVYSSTVPAVMHDFSSKEKCVAAGEAIVKLGRYESVTKRVFSPTDHELVARQTFTCTEK